MEKIIVRPKNAEEAKEVLALLQKMKIETEVYPVASNEIARDRTKEEILDSIERGMQEVEDYKAGKIKLKDAKSLLNEL